VGWGQYLNIFFDTVLGFSLPESIAGPPGEGGRVNLPAVFIVLAITGLLIIGVRESARTNSIMVLVVGSLPPRRRRGGEQCPGSHSRRSPRRC
jgi:basic amino acid/polyamine antiporter, APA family